MRTVPVLLYHSVAEDPRGTDRYTVSKKTFEAHVAAIKASGRTALRISELACSLRQERTLPAHAVAVTFDDGYADTYDAVDRLLELDLYSTVYVTTSELGAANRLTRLQVTELAQGSPTEIGAHGVRHRHLDELDDAEVAREVNSSKIQLEDLIQDEIESFAYPHGSYDQRVRQSVIDAGYSSAAAVKNALSHTSDDPFAIARWMVTRNTSAARITQVLEGENVPVAWSHERARTRAYRAARRIRRRFTQAWRTTSPQHERMAVVDNEP
jgi:peptidoglycan/xylan/chitin deacetylase (PgdA/CDA1 family)